MKVIVKTQGLALSKMEAIGRLWAEEWQDPLQWLCDEKKLIAWNKQEQKQRDALEDYFGGLDKSSGSEKWSQSGYILKAEPTGFASE